MKPTPIIRSVVICLVLLGMGVGITGCDARSAQKPAESTTETPADTDSPATAFSAGSDAFADGGAIPVEHAMEGAGGMNVSIPVSWSGVPSGTRSFAIEVVDMHPIAGQWVHWLACDIPADVTKLDAGASGSAMPPGTTEFKNDFGSVGWGGPQPPEGSGLHEYRVIVYALDTEKTTPSDVGVKALRTAIEGHVLAQAQFVGTFER